MKKANAANSKKTAKRDPTPASWKPGQSGNPAGRPAEGESWAAVIKRIANMTGDEASTYVAEFAKQFKPLKGVTLKEAVVMRCFAALMFEPQASMLNALMDRAEGKVAETHKHEGGMSVVNLNADLANKTESQVKHDLSTFASVAARLVGGMDGGAKPAEAVDSTGQARRTIDARGD